MRPTTLLLLNYLPKNANLLLLQIRESPFRSDHSKFHSILLFQPLLVCHRGLLIKIILNEIASDESIQLCQIILVWKTSTLAIIPFWMKFNFFEQKQMQSPPWLSRWRVRRVLIHMRRAKNGTYWNWLRVTKNVTKLRRDESTLQSWDPEFNPYW